MIAKSAIAIILVSLWLLKVADAHKPIVDSSAIKKWLSVGDNLVISNDGNYFIYAIEEAYTLQQQPVVQSTNNNWERKFPGATSGFFIGDNMEVGFQRGDTLFFFV